MEASLPALSGDILSERLDKLKEMQDNWIRKVLLNSKPTEHYHVKTIKYTWKDVQYGNKGIRTDIIFKDVI